LQPAEASDAVHYFGFVTGIDVAMFINGDDANSPPGPTLNIGDSTDLTYVVTNVGNVALSTVVLRDNNGTGADAGDDFLPTFIGGDTDADNWLDINETWTYAATGGVVAGQQMHVALLSANSNTVFGGDLSYYFGVVPENADFNTDSMVDAADYVVWRKFGGLTVPAGTLGDANHDTDVDDEDYAIYQTQFGTSGGGDGISSTGALAANEEAASHDAAFNALGGNMLGARTSSRAAAGPPSRPVAAIQDEWAALLSVIADRQVDRGTMHEPLDFYDVGLREIETQLAEFELAGLRWVPGASLSMPRFKLR
jgi:hypothetical protein